MPDLQPLIEVVTAWEGVSASPHRFGGVEFALGRVEIGHIHLHSGLVDIPFTRSIRAALVEAGEAQAHHLLADSGWISFRIRTNEDIDQARRLFRLSYLQKRSRRDKTFAATRSAELDGLRFRDGVRAAVLGRTAESDDE
jgi:hypothetical protein